MVPMTKNNPNNETLKAGTPLCPICCVAYIETEIDLQIDDIILRNVKTLRCPICQNEQFTPTQQETIIQKLQQNQK
jgi:hypothetical protein